MSHLFSRILLVLKTNRLSKIRGFFNPTSRETVPSTPSMAKPSTISLTDFKQNRTLCNILAIMSCFHASPVPIDLLRSLAHDNHFSSAIEKLHDHWAIRWNVSRNSIELEPEVRSRVQLELRHRADRSQFLNLALQVALAVDLGGRHSLGCDRDLAKHVSSVLDVVQSLAAPDVVFLHAAGLALRHCRFLRLMGKYSAAANFVVAFQFWCQNLLGTNVDIASALMDEECTAEAAMGNLETTLKISLEVTEARRKCFGKNSKKTIQSINNEGLIHQRMGNYQQAVQCHRTALATSARVFGNTAPETLRSIRNLGIVYQLQGKNDIAELFLSQCLIIWQFRYTEDNLMVLAAKSSRGITLHFQGRLDEAELEHRDVYHNRLRLHGARHHDTLKSKANLAITLNAQGRHAHAETMYREALADLTQELGSSHPDVLKTHYNLALALQGQRKFAEAETVVRDALPLLLDKHDRKHFGYLRALELQAILLHHMQEYAAALVVATHLVKIRAELFGYRNLDTQRIVRHMKTLDSLA